MIESPEDNRICEGDYSLFSMDKLKDINSYKSTAW